MAMKQQKMVATAHTAGIFADGSLDGPEIGTLVAVVDRARNLPNRKTVGKQDPYCAMRLGKEARKTNTDRRGGQTPRWDQELRFPVHEAPDYYRMKCSIFNDDKKTDLIGECFIDLQEVIVSGGGQNDLWHQLHFKGKYAGEIRIELTFYDSRPASESQIDGKKRSNRARSVASESPSTTSTVRQLGPREIKRRPLPPGPGQTVSPQPVTQASSTLPHLQQQPQQSYPTPPASVNEYPDQSYIMPLQPSYRPQHQQHQQQRWPTPETPDDISYDQQSSSFQPETYNSSGYYTDHASFNTQYESERSFQYDQEGSPIQYHQSSPYSSGRPSPQSTPGIQSSWPQSSPPISSHTHSLHNSPKYYDNPSAGQGPSAPQAFPVQTQRTGRADVSPTKHVVYRDSPLRYSVNQNELSYSQRTDPVNTGRTEIDTPPPPPIHRDRYPRKSVPHSYRSIPDSSALPTTPLGHHTIEDRSPLQSLELSYGSQQISPATAPPPSRQSARGPSPRPSPQTSQGSRPSLHDRRGSSTGEFPAPHQMSTNYGVDLEEPVEQDRQGRYVRRLSSNEPQDDPYKITRDSQSTRYVDVFDERNTYRSEPQVIRPRAVSPNPAYIPPRKSVSPQPYYQDPHARVNQTPFGPDSYEMINPVSSPANTGSLTPQQLSEVRRQVEVDKLRDVGPIIGNDGRVIDPSDHLPSDTWAPEPERKNRKPEVVIRFRTKEESRGQNRTHSSPLPTQPTTSRHSPYSGSPNAAVSPLSVNHSSPNLPSLPPSNSGRSKLQKPMPTRPLPVQPFQHAHTSPAAVPQITGRENRYNDEQRDSTNSSPSAKAWNRPPLSEYQVPTGNSYDPRLMYQQNLPQTPTKMPLRPQSYAHNGYQDPLTAELNMIDIGPGRSGGRTGVRQNRGFGGY